MKATDFLIQEHKILLHALDLLDAMSAFIQKTGTVQQRDAEKILDFLRWFADAHHQAKEETILFPALTRAAAGQNRSVEHLTREHDQERSLIEAMEKDLRLARISEFVGCAARLSETLRNHMYKEDRIIFAEADAVFSPEEDDAVFEALSRFDTAIERDSLNLKVDELRALEWKYLRR